MTTAALSVPPRSWAFDAALEGLTRVNERLLSGGAFPPLYSAGVRYRTEPREVWRHAADVLGEGWGDCEDLAAWRAAELRVSGEDPDAAVATYKSAPRRYHAVVLRGDGSIEDPSRQLGMKGRTKMHDDDDALEGDPETLAYCEGLADTILGQEPDYGYDDPYAYPEPEPEAALVPDPVPHEPYRVLTDARPSRGGWRGVARVPLRTGRALITASSSYGTQARAAKAALRLATRALDSPFAQRLLPPPAKLALNLIKSKTARNIARRIGKLRKLF